MMMTTCVCVLLYVCIMINVSKKPTSYVAKKVYIFHLELADMGISRIWPFS